MGQRPGTPLGNVDACVADAAATGHKPLSRPSPPPTTGQPQPPLPAGSATPAHLLSYGRRISAWAPPGSPTSTRAMRMVLPSRPPSSVEEKGRGRPVVATSSTCVRHKPPFLQLGWRPRWCLARVGSSWAPRQRRDNPCCMHAEQQPVPRARQHAHWQRSQAASQPSNTAVASHLSWRRTAMFFRVARAQGHHSGQDREVAASSATWGCGAGEGAVREQ